MAEEIYDQNIYDNIKKFGYHEIISYDFSCESYKLLYEEFDDIVNLIKNDDKFVEYNKIMESNFIASETKTSNNYIIGFNYIKPQNNRKNVKVYFHFSQEYFMYIKVNNGNVLIEYSIFNNFLNKLYQLFVLSHKYFDNSIKELNKTLPDLKRIMYLNKKDLIIYVKICVHEPDQFVAERTHTDFSGFTLLLHNDDIDEHHLHVAPNNQDGELKYEVYNKKYKKFNNQEYSLPIIFPGHSLQKISIKINPTPHYVSQLSKTRHSMIAFCMVPNVICNFTEPFKY